MMTSPTVREFEVDARSTDTFGEARIILDQMRQRRLTTQLHTGQYDRLKFRARRI